MIFEHLDRAASLTSLHRHFAACFEWLRRLPADLPPGRYEIAGEDAYALVQIYTTFPAAERRYETHRRYLDIQFVATGEECIRYAPVESLPLAGTYDPAKDLQFHQEPAAESSLVLGPGTFAVFYPPDGHKPCTTHREPSAVRKVVIKVRVP
jgi:biofilm protein TabA